MTILVFYILTIHEYKFQNVFVASHECFHDICECFTIKLKIA